MAGQVAVGLVDLGVIEAGGGDADELRAIPSWRAHLHTGDRKGAWSLSITKNWRLMFCIDETEGEIVDLDFEDYH